MTGDICLIIADANGDEMCILKEDYRKKSWKKAAKRFGSTRFFSYLYINKKGNRSSQK